MDRFEIESRYKNVIEHIDKGGGVLKYQKASDRFIIVNKNGRRKYVTPDQLDLEEDRLTDKTGSKFLQRVKNKIFSNKIDIQ